jgi:hypothetical protein
MNNLFLSKIMNKFSARMRVVHATHLKKKAIEGLLNRYKKSHALDEKRILVWTAPGGMSSIIEVDSIIATALRLRNARLKFVLCDGAPVACIMREVDINHKPSTWKEYCKTCYKSARKRLEPFGLQYYRIGEFLNDYKRQIFEDKIRKTHREELEILNCDNIDIGKLAVASTLRYSKGKHIENNDDIVRRYIFAGLVNLNAAEQAINEFSPDFLLMSHGTYVDWGVAFKYGVSKKIPTVIWNSAYEKNHFFFRNETRDFAKHRLERISEERWKKTRNRPLKKNENKRLIEYIKKRYNSSDQQSNRNDNSAIKEHVNITNTLTKQYDTSILPPPQYAPKELRAKLGTDNNKPIWTLFTHVLWEGIYNYGPILFKDETSWLLRTIEKMLEVENVNWLIRIHPGELQYPASKSALDTIQKAFPSLPDHIKIIAPSKNINTLDILHLIDGGITIFGTVGLELAIQGKPAILCGNGFYGDKGFTYDCKNEKEFFNLLKDAYRLPPLSNEQIQLARKYALLFFLKSQIPISCLKEDTEIFGWTLDADKISLLKPNCDLYIDLICDGVLHNKNFIITNNRV